jgi:hypothetical protein
MIKITSCVFSVVFFAFIYAIPANSSMVTFDAVPSSGNPIITILTTDGFTFTSGHFHTVDSPTIANFGGSVANGTIFIGEEAGSLGLPITMANSLGNPFSLVGFDGAEAFLNSTAAAAVGYSNASNIVLNGVLFGGGTLSATFALDGIKDGLGGVNDFQSFLLPAWTNLSSVTFSGLTDAGGHGGFALDNIDVNTSPVPIPATLLLFGSGLLGLTWFRKKLKK